MKKIPVGDSNEKWPKRWLDASFGPLFFFKFKYLVVL